MCEAHAAWGRSFWAAQTPLPAPDWGSLPAAPERLHIGYLSADLYTHSVSYFVEAPLRHHNPDRCGCLPERPVRPSSLAQTWCWHGGGPVQAGLGIGDCVDPPCGAGHGRLSCCCRADAQVMQLSDGHATGSAAPGLKPLAPTDPQGTDARTHGPLSERGCIPHMVPAPLWPTSPACAGSSSRCTAARRTPTPRQRA